MKVCVTSANCGAYEQSSVWPALIAPSGVTVDVHRFTDENFPPRPLAMTSRLQCGIPKWDGAALVPGADLYMWLDASCAPTPTAVQWFLGKMAASEIAVFAHPERKTIRDEYDFMKARMARPGETYLNARYKGEDLDGQFAYIDSKGLAGLPLYASTAFIYRPTARVLAALRECLFLKLRFLLHDQLAFPFVLHTHGCRVNVIRDNYLKCEGLQFVRTGKRRAA